MFRSDEEFLRTRRRLVEYCARIDPVRFPEWRFPFQTYDEYEENGWAKVAPIVSQWIPSRKSKTRSLFQTAAQKVMVINRFVTVFTRTLVDLAGCDYDYKHVAVLKDGTLALVPRLSQKGDLVIIDRSVLSERSAYAIFRPCENPLSPEEEGLLRKDLASRNSIYGLGHAPIENCRFIASAPSIWSVPLKGGDPCDVQIFAVH